MLIPAHVPLPASPALTPSRRSSASSGLFHPSPLTALHPRPPPPANTPAVKPQGEDPFREGATISVNQPVGSISISPSSRDVCLASRKGLYILDLANLNNAPRFVPQGGAWQIADVQWSPHPATSSLILSTSSQKLLVWDLAAPRPLLKSFDAHSRAITDINWHALNPNLMATVSMDAGIRGWDLRCFDRPIMRLCDWGAAGTQVKWNRRHDHLIATAHGKIVHIWDDRKGSLPITTIHAHDAKIYGIDWDRQYRQKLVTCSLDKTIKFWTVPELGGDASDSSVVYHSSLPAVSTPSYTIPTHYPVWRARNLPFGRGVLSLPQRGEKALEMFGMDDPAPVERFAGHENVVKDFVWRMRGGNDSAFDDREFQLVTWSKDRTLRIWPVSREVEERVGWQFGAPIEMLVSRRGAPDVTYTKDPSNTDIDAPRLLPSLLPLTVSLHPNTPSNLTRQKSVKPVGEAQQGMTRGGNKVRRMDQLEWLTKVVKNAPSPESSSVWSSRMASVSRTRRAVSRGASRLGSRSESAEGTQEWKSLKDEVVAIDLAHHKLTISMQGPWANGDRQAFMRIHWSFPQNYPFGPEIPAFELERNPTVSPIIRQTIVMNIKEIRAHNKQCLVETTGYLLGLHERQGRRRGMDEESDSESERGEEINRRDDIVPEVMLRKTCGATFGPNGQLVCFFPKQVTIPRTRNFSRSPSITRENPSPMLKAISALTRLQNPHQRAVLHRYKPRTRRLDPISSPAPQPPPPPAGSTMTIHDVSYLGQPNVYLAKMYGMSVEANMSFALEAKRLDHADVWATVRGILADPPPPYTRLPQLDENQESLVRRERMVWEKGMERKKRVVDRLFTNLMAERDVQMLALLACILLEYTRSMYIPPPAESVTNHSPLQDYFNLRFPLPPHNITPVRRRTASSVIPILNPSSISFRGALTPKDRTSFSDMPFSRTMLSTSYEEHSSSDTGLAIPTSKQSDSPKPIQGDKGKASFRTSSMSPPVATTPLRSTGTERSLHGGGGVGGGGGEQQRSYKVSFGSTSPITRGGRSQSSTGYVVGGGGLGSAVTTGPNTPEGGGERKIAVGRSGGVKLDFPKDESSTPSLLPQEMLPLCEAWKLSYADFLLRHNLLGVRTILLSYRFITSSTSAAINAATGKSSGIVRAEVGETEKTDDGLSVIRVCVPCSGTPSGTCPSCNKQPQKAVCSYCRVPIKGISMGCTICAHKFHAKCFQRYFCSPVTTPMTCPACSCSCLAHRGISTPVYTVAALPKQSPNITRGFNREKVPSGNAPLAGSKPVPSQDGRSQNSPEEGKGRLTYASLVKLGAIRENFGLGFTDGGHSGATSVLGFHADGDGDEVHSDRERTGREHRCEHRGDGLLSRARRGGEGLLHWGSTTHHQ
ncbi:vacuolar membrane protein [Cryptococcus deuterogattii 2001/935-1]|nr:vacuolar membrane protein [Cryptococcus deuterogattii 2001/935-1]